MSRGLRNNNPGNIRISATKYLGEVQPSQYRAFKQFESMPWGYRAMFVLLHTYQTRHGLRTIRQMIDRYAPPNENDTGAYTASVCRWSGVAPDGRVSTTNRDVMIPVVAAMSRMENGTPAIVADVWDGWELFLKHKP